MKIANSEVIKKREQEWFGVIAENLNWEAIRQVLKDKHGLNIGEDVTYRHAAIEAKESKILYSIDFDVNITLSIQLDRDGELVGVKNSPSEGLGTENVGEGEHQGSQSDAVGSSDIGLDALEKAGVIEKEPPGKLENESAPDESEGGYEDVLMEFGSDSSGKSD
jgi:hypothetical protein